MKHLNCRYILNIFKFFKHTMVVSFYLCLLAELILKKKEGRIVKFITLPFSYVGFFSANLLLYLQSTDDELVT